jgi:hypothetical protein
MTIRSINGISSRPLIGRRRQRSVSMHPGKAKRGRSAQEAGFAYLLALGMMLLMIAGSLVLLEMGATQNRRQREAEAIWRGNQYARAIRLFYHKTGHYPQNLDDLQKGLPQLHFIRQAYKNPMNASDGSWRLIYVNAAGQIIGSTRYATLQQMALLDSNGGQMPGIPNVPGQPGVPAASLADSANNSDSSQGQLGSNGTVGTANGAPTDSSNPNGSGANPNPPADGQNTQTPIGTNPQNPATGAPGQGNPQNLLGAAQPNALSQGSTAASLAAIAQLKPTGPVDGPVLGAFLTGVGGKGDTKSVKVYHGGKKYIDWEFIWNPLEDAAAAMQQQMGNPSPLPGQTQGTTSTFGGFGGNNPGQQNPAPTQPAPGQPGTGQQPPQQ